jgi:hypothetical protein
MKKIFLRLLAFVKGFILVLRPGIFLGWLRRPLLMGSNILSLSKWISAQDQQGIYNDFYSPSRDYSKRYKLYQYLIDTLKLNDESFDYLEFGVCEAHSFRWWVKNCNHPGSRFYGFDTFEGLPEQWGAFAKGDMIAGIPIIDDSRVKFEKGLFQETVPPFLANQHLTKGNRKILHLDADLFTSTLYALTSLAPYLKKGDILIFDEFNVPNHEFFAFKIFSESYYVKTKLLCAVNNYFQVALIIE